MVKTFGPNQDEGAISISTSRLLLASSVISFWSILGNLLIACSTNFNCNAFIPSPGYLGCFRGHDRLFIAGCTFSSFALGLFYTAAYIQLRPRLSLLSQNIFILLSTFSSISLSLLALSDEVVGIHLLPVTKIYAFSCSTFVISSVILAALIYKEINNLYDSLRTSEKIWLWVLRAVLFAIGTLAVIAIVAWKYSYSSLSEKVFNSNVQSISEWGATSLSIFLPYIYSKLFRNSTLSFLIFSHVEENTEIEMSETVS